MNLWLVIPGITLIVATIIVSLLLDPVPSDAETPPIRSLITVIVFLAGISMLFEGLLGFTAG
jgi:hypothetical protein